MKNSIGQFLTTLRKAKGYSQQEVADKLFVSNKTISSWECDTTSPDLTILPLIADLYGVTCDEIIRGVKNNKQKQEDKLELSESNIKIILNNSFQRIEKGLNICNILILSSTILFIFSVVGFFINIILGVVLLIISIITYFVPFFLFSNYYVTANNAAIIESDSKEISLYYRKLYLIKKTFKKHYSYPVIVVVLTLLFFLTNSLVIGLNLSIFITIIIYSIILILSFTLIMAYVNYNNHIFLVNDSKYKISDTLENKILFNIDLTKKLKSQIIKLGLVISLLIIIINVFITPVKKRFNGVDHFVSYLQTYTFDNTIYGTNEEISKIIDYGYIKNTITQPNTNIVDVYYKDGDPVIYIFVNEHYIGYKSNIVIYINNYGTIYLLNNDVAEYYYTSSSYYVITTKAVKNSHTIKASITYSLLFIYIIYFIYQVKEYNKEKMIFDILKN